MERSSGRAIPKDLFYVMVRQIDGVLIDTSSRDGGMVKTDKEGQRETISTAREKHTAPINPVHSNSLSAAFKGP